MRWSGWSAAQPALSEGLTDLAMDWKKDFDASESEPAAACKRKPAAVPPDCSRPLVAPGQAVFPEGGRFAAHEREVQPAHSPHAQDARPSASPGFPLPTLPGREGLDQSSALPARIEPDDPARAWPEPGSPPVASLGRLGPWRLGCAAPEAEWERRRAEEEGMASEASIYLPREIHEIRLP